MPLVFGFLMFAGSIENDHWNEIGSAIRFHNFESKGSETKVKYFSFIICAVHIFHVNS